MLELIPGELVLVKGGTGLYGSAIWNVEDMGLNRHCARPKVSLLAFPGT
jgi:hypothetical protein